VRRNVHKGQVPGADELDWRPLEEPVVFFADKGGIVDSLPTNVVYVGIDADDTDIVVIRFETVEGDVLADQDADSDTAHVESVEEGLDGPVDRLAALFLFEFEDPLCHGGHDRVVPPLDIGEQLGEAFVVVVHLWGPTDVHLWVRIVPCRDSRECPIVVTRNGRLTDAPEVSADSSCWCDFRAQSYAEASSGLVSHREEVRLPVLPSQTPRGSLSAAQAWES
jgi:hypothetical protein